MPAWGDNLREEPDEQSSVKAALPTTYSIPQHLCSSEEGSRKVMEECTVILYGTARVFNRKVFVCFAFLCVFVTKQL